MKQPMTANIIGKWLILIVDDEEDIHELLQITLRDITYNGKEVAFLNAYTALEAQEIVSNHADIAVIILDVMMEEDDSGLGFVKFIREQLKNLDTRILLHTGQPGIAPKKEVSERYMIDGYLDKNVADNDDCYVATRLALASYEERLKLKDAAVKDDVGLLKEIAIIYTHLLADPEFENNTYEAVVAKINAMVHLSQKILAIYALEDLQNDLNQGTTKESRLSFKDYSALILIHDIKVIFMHMSIEKYDIERSITFSMLVQAAKYFCHINILPNAPRQLLEKSLKVL